MDVERESKKNMLWKEVFLIDSNWKIQPFSTILHWIKSNHIENTSENELN